MNAATVHGAEPCIDPTVVPRACVVSVVVHEDPVPTTDPLCSQSIGLHPVIARVVVKHPAGSRVGLGETAADTLHADLPGADSPHRVGRPFPHVHRPRSPLDSEAALAASLAEWVRPVARRSSAPYGAWHA